MERRVIGKSVGTGSTSWTFKPVSLWHPEIYIRAIHLQNGKCFRARGLSNLYPLIEAGQPTDLRQVSIALEDDAIIPGAAYPGQQAERATTHLTIGSKRGSHIAQTQTRFFGQAARGQEIEEAFPLHPPDLDTAPGDHAAEIPIHRTDRHTQLGRESGLGDARVLSDSYEELKILLERNGLHVIHSWSPGVQNSAREFYSASVLSQISRLGQMRPDALLPAQFIHFAFS